MLWRAWQAFRVEGLGGPSRLLAERIAAVETLVAVLALVTGLATLFALRPRERRHTLRLGASKPPQEPRNG